MTRIRVLVVEDSRTTRALLVRTLSVDPGFEVVGEAHDGDTALSLCKALRPDVVTLDMVLLGEKTGTQVTEHIMSDCPTPILIVSSSFNRGEVARTFEALEAGAVDVIEKPSGREPEGAWERSFLQALKLVSRIKVITHPRPRLREPSLLGSSAIGGTVNRSAISPRAQRTRRELIAIGASTGGPGAVVEILRHAPPAPVLLVIHISKPFTLGLVDWLRGVLQIPVGEVVDGQPLPAPGVARVLVAPAERHLIVQGGRLRLHDAPERNACRPSIDVLFESVAESYGPRSVGCLLTGMGRDGAAGLLQMRKQGAFTIAQDQSTCIVFGMPQEAIRIGGAERVLRLPEIGPELVALVR